MGQLVIKRRWQERVFLDIPPGFCGRIVVQVTDTQPTYCRLGFDAPPAVKVWREELTIRPQAVPAESADGDDAEFREGIG